MSKFPFFCICTVFVVRFLRCTRSEDQIYYLGAIFEDTDREDKEFALRLGMERQLASRHSYGLKFVAGRTKPDNPFEATRITRSIFDEQTEIVAVFGPTSEKNARAVHGICDNKEIPLIETRIGEYRTDNERTLINMRPHPPVLNRALSEIVRFFEWGDLTILYEDAADLVRFGELLTTGNDTETTVVVRQLDKTHTGNYRSTFKEAQRSDETRFVLDCSLTVLDEVLKQAQQVGLITEGYSFIVTNLDAQTLDLTPYQYGETTIIMVGLLDFEDGQVVDVYKRTHGAETGLAVPRTEVGLILDALKVLVHALDQLQPNETASPFVYGYSVLNYIKSVSDSSFSWLPFAWFHHFSGCSRRNHGHGTVRSSGLPYRLPFARYAPPQQSRTVDDGTSLKNVTFRVLTALTPPYAMLRQSTSKLSGNAQYEGFGIDLIHELSMMEGFGYEFSLREDKANGAKSRDGTWTGMIGDIIANKVDLAIADLTITAEREEAVEFTSPFMSLGVSILYRKPAKAPPSFFSFAAPFALEVWMLLAGATFGVSISLYVMGRLCPAEWSNPYPCVQEPRYLLNQFSLRNSVWFAVGSLMQQGSEIAPVGVSTRMVAGIWWFFTLIMVSCYTANLAASLTSESPEQHFGNLKELVERADRIGIKYGAKQGGSTETFFKQGAKNKTEFKVVHEHMQAYPSEMVQDNTVGVTRAENGKYAFFMESTSIEYEVQRHCNLTQVGSKLDEKGYGIAMRKNSSYRHRLSTALLKLQSTGVIDQLKRKWWEEKGGQCSNEEPPEGAPPLDFKNVSGIFWVTIGGTTSALLMVVVELVLHTFKTSMRTGSAFRRQLGREVRFYFKVDEFVKPVDGNRNETATNNDVKQD